MSSDTAANRPAMPRRWISFLLAILLPGANLVYLGQRALGWRFLCASLALSLSSLVVLESLPIDQPARIFLPLALMCVSLFLFGLALWRSIRIRKAEFVARTGRAREWLVFVGLIILNTIVPITALERLYPGDLNRVYYIPSQSMLPTLAVNDRLFAVRTEPKAFARGDLIIFDHQGSDFIKRLIGLPGDTIVVENNVAYVNEHKESWTPASSSPHLYSVCSLAYCHQAFLSDRNFGAQNRFQVSLGLDQYFVLGDHRDRSQDSRYIGPISADKIKRRASVKYWPQLTSLKPDQDR